MVHILYSYQAMFNDMLEFHSERRHVSVDNYIDDLRYSPESGVPHAHIAAFKGLFNDDGRKFEWREVMDMANENEEKIKEAKEAGKHLEWWGESKKGFER